MLYCLNVAVQAKLGTHGRAKTSSSKHDQYARKMCFNVWGDRNDQFNIQEGEELTVSFDIDCREWNGKWFNDIRAWKVERTPAGMAQGAPIEPFSAPSAPNFPPTDQKDDLPF